MSRTTAVVEMYSRSPWASPRSALAVLRDESVRLDHDLLVDLANRFEVFACVVDRGEDAADDFEPGSPFIVGKDHAPRRRFRVRLAQHAVGGVRIAVPFVERRNVDVGDLPLPQRIVPPVVE